jgi:hypothetical protein
MFKCLDAHNSFKINELHREKGQKSGKTPRKRTKKRSNKDKKAEEKGQKSGAIRTKKRRFASFDNIAVLFIMYLKSMLYKRNLMFVFPYLITLIIPLIIPFYRQ